MSMNISVLVKGQSSIEDVLVDLKNEGISLAFEEPPASGALDWWESMLP